MAARLEPLSGYLLLAQKAYTNNSYNGESFNFGPETSSAHTVLEVIEKMISYWDHTKPSKFFDISGNIKFHESGLLKLNCEKALYHLKWIPTLGFEDLVKFTTSWYSNFYENKINMLDFTLNQIEKYEEIATSKGLVWAK